MKKYFLFKPMQKFAKVGYSTEFDKANFFFAHVKACCFLDF